METNKGVVAIGILEVLFLPWKYCFYLGSIVFTSSRSRKTKHIHAFFQIGKSWSHRFL